MGKSVEKWEKIIKAILVILVGAGAVVAMFYLLQFMVGYQLYAFFLDKAYLVFGLDLVLARALAISAAVLAFLAIPWLLSLVFMRKKLGQLVLVVIISAIVCSVALYYGTADVLFDRDGRVVKYYLKTLGGFVFSSTGDVDPKFGARFKPFTPEIAKEYYLWKKTGALGEIPKIKEGVYFDRLTGEPIVWYSKRSDGEIHLSPLPGYDIKTGQPLKPMTIEVAEEIEKEKARLEQERKAAKERKVAEEKARVAAVEKEKEERARKAAEERTKREGAEKAVEEQAIKKERAALKEKKHSPKSLVIAERTKKDLEASSSSIDLLSGMEFSFRDLPDKETKLQVKNFLSTYEIRLVSIELLHNLHPKFNFLLKVKSDNSNKMAIVGVKEERTHLTDQDGRKYRLLSEASNFPEVSTPGLPVQFSLVFERLPHKTRILNIVFYIGEWFYFNPGSFSVGVFFQNIELKQEFLSRQARREEGTR